MTQLAETICPVTQVHITEDLNPLGNPNPEVRASGVVCNMALYHSSRPDLQVRVCCCLLHQQHRFENLQTSVKEDVCQINILEKS
jgi:hypothetical protein